MPGLLTLQTDLKSLKYGQDRPNGGNSGQPYIQTDINSVDATFNRVRLTNFDDGFIRGGAVASQNASAVDTLRIGKFLTDPPKGPLFLARQVGLQLSNPQLEHIDDLPTNRTGTNRPTKGQGFFRNVGNAVTNGATSIGAFIANTANRIENEVGPTRIYNLGINTLAQVSVNAIGGHIVRHGFLPVEDPSKYYEAVVTQNNFENNSNRLEQYASNFSLGGMDNIINKTNYNTDLEITSYVGGPSSVYGIGRTFIRRYTNSNEKYKIDGALASSKAFAGRTRGDNGDAQDIAFGLDRLLGLSNLTGSILSVSGSSTSPLANNDDNIPVNLNTRYSTTNTNIADDKSGLNHASIPPINAIKIVDTFDYGLSKKTTSIFSDNSFTDLPTQIGSNSPFLFYTASNADTGSSIRKHNLPINGANDLVASGPSSYPDKNIAGIAPLDVQNTVYDYGTSPAGKTYTTIKNRVAAGSKIKQNYFITQDVAIDRKSPTFQYNTGAKVAFNRTNDRVLKDDEIKVIFTPINPFTGGQVPNQFLAYLTGYSENYDSGWDDIRYAGRAESFYIFKSFKRTVTFGLNVPCYNQEELMTNHKKLFALGERGLGYALAGQYSENNLMGGVIIKLTVGNYLVDCPGIVNSMKFDIVDNSSWDLDKQYAHYLKVDFSFTVIGNQLPIYENIVKTEPTQSVVIPPPPPVIPPVKKTIEIPPATSDYTGKGAGFETSQGRTDAQRAFNERQLDARLGL
jgi:hypothetical protein